MSLKRGARILAFLIIAALLAWAVYLLVVGQPNPVYAEGQAGDALPPPQIIYVRYLPALYSVFALLVVAVGLIRDEWLLMAWIGLALHLIAGGLLIFGWGIVYIAATGALAAPVGIVHWQASGERRWLWGAWAGVVVLLVVGALMAWNPFGYAALALAAILGVVLWVVGHVRRTAPTPH